MSSPKILANVGWKPASSDGFLEDIEAWRRKLDHVLPEGLPAGVVALPLLPTAADERILMLVLDASEEEHTRCALWVIDPEDIEPEDEDEDEAAEEPERSSSPNGRSLRAAATLVGDARHVLELASKYRPKEAVRHSIHFHLDAAENECHLALDVPIAPTDSDAAILALGGSAKRKRAVFALTGGANGLLELDVRYSPKEKRYYVNAQATGILRVGNSDRWLPFADEVHEAIKTTVFAG